MGTEIKHMPGPKFSGKLEIWKDVVEGTLTCDRCGAMVGVRLKLSFQDKMEGHDVTQMDIKKVRDRVLRTAMQKHAPNCSFQNHLYTDKGTVDKYFGDLKRGVEKHKEQELQLKKKGIILP